MEGRAVRDRQTTSALVVVLLLACLVSGCRGRGGAGEEVGPNLLPEEDAKSLVLSLGVLADITESYLQTSGPIYRVLRGHDQSGRDRFVWVDLRVVHSVLADSGASREEILDKARPFFSATSAAQAELVFIPPELKVYPCEEFICQSSGNVFWLVQIYDDQQQCRLSLWYSFESGELLGN